LPTRASHLRTNSTDAERHLWQFLRNRQLGGYKFRRQHPLPPYTVDFVCLERRLIVELDGGQHAEAIAYDAARTDYLEQSGYLVLRFWNDEALSNTQEVLTRMLQKLEERPHGESNA
jgi:very-short-patch-repair endonuclease